MCTVTFIPRKTSYLVGMNRDEKLTRVRGVPPSQRVIDGRRVIYPSEPSGGTWVSLNDAGVTFALINWYSVPAQPNGKVTSRGEIIPTICSALNPQTVSRQLVALPLQSLRPFRLIGIFQSSRQIKEWQWNLKAIIEKDWEWQPRQWISSGFEEAIAQIIRSRTFRKYQSQPSCGTIDWLRRLHRSHCPTTGPFSTCMHRNDATTVSYTEIWVSAHRRLLRQICNNPCQSPLFTHRDLMLASKSRDPASHKP
jgi:transport and Golgi organization protein 2